ncbi:hypothetical protein CEUSTIGMA_g9761.t1 [Chlamydomonas eustigma]|uniref:Uncharacterized protein n=1 Tax=Chlamydomonas eustigma TaxID=1157962 RepID=A0A250XHD2_9CHLO|nr:hypothetical protein CEUSTIGMA_g9761.t1 [Chlamydomonas eustigma]|eukprot:GAX82332.1 hypothetical protein CEUSTIGMA_g9761.t1 [Chlamydomonas eustigma]
MSKQGVLGLFGIFGQTTAAINSNAVQALLFIRSLQWKQGHCCTTLGLPWSWTWSNIAPQNWHILKEEGTSSCRAAGGASNGECKYHEYAGKWQTHVVVSSDEKKAKKQTLDAYGLSLAQSVRPCPGSLTVVALRHDDPKFIAEYKYFLLKVLENPTLSGGLTSNVESDDYGQGPWPKGSLMLKGQYFEVYRGKTKKEMLTTQGLVMEQNEDKIAYVHAEAIIMLRVCLSALTAPNYKTKLFSLSVEEHDRILQCINGNVSDYTYDDLSDDGML